ncbi:hypothetical protein P153DRAFT_382210 [Dothidotthia symphoricarpi CBS 119687]|uniref:DUF7896 domain-containing protein n=1 Tax=Dothidotthia symphoricarpi CBS 119687 TaxID=1392245 RepID=A0A6A6ANW8_9PLEO|nr:uncharacterized protein P153DRAFT_382210 [Dothidotthia symphoricarpi CBS 119687]KAF2132587.1 hypothetical protein P153DRAFT_382210 [Dothidotthia symphoricarpi CBS 119687]
MDMALPYGDNAYPYTLEQAQQDLWSGNVHLSGEQQDFSFQAASATDNAYNNAQASLACQIPRSMPYNASSLTQFPMSNIGTMDRTRSAPTMGVSASTASWDDSNLQRSATSFPAWQQEPVTDYALFSGSSMRRMSNLQPIADVTAFPTGSMVEYSPAEYIDNCIEQRSSPLLPLALPQQSQQLQVQLTPGWGTSSDGSISPSTPSTALTTPVTQTSNPMSRQGSYTPNFSAVSMLRAQSSSSMLPILSEDSSLSFPCESETISACVDGSSFFPFTGPASEIFLSTVPSVSASAQGLASSQNELYLAEDMRRSASTTSSEGNASDVSVPSSSCSRQSQREREINAQAASRKIAPKAIPSNNDETTFASSNAQMARIQSSDGSSKTVGILTKTAYVRPSHPKIKCVYCDERPNGFRGTHELDRHIARAHSSRRKGYICVDFSSDKKFLANCKHCRGKKVYGAYYNAAAHLRRAHFHPRKRGRKGKNDEKRGGIGGGDHPPMEYLKQNWIKEVEVDNKRTPQSPESASDSAPEPSSYDMHSYASSSSQQQQQQAPDVMEIQPPINQPYIDFGLDLNASEMMYDANAFAAYELNDANNFQFDASYMPQ